MNLPPIFEETYLGNPLWRWLLVPMIVAVVMILLRVLRGVLLRYLQKLAKRTEAEIDDLIVDLINKTSTILFFFIALYFGALSVTLPPSAKKILATAAIISLLLQVGLWMNKVIQFGVGTYINRNGEKQDNESAVKTLSLIGQGIMWALILLLALDNIPGVEVTSLIAGLGISGVAAALAVRNILGDLFASLAILLDKPFVIGDFIAVDDLMGTVEEIGLKTTRVRSINGEELVFSNSDLLNSRIHNYKEMNERLVIFRVGVVYETPLDKLKKIPGMIQEIIQAQSDVRFDRAHLAGMGDSALNYESVYFVLSPDYALYMNIQQTIIYTVMERFEEEGIVTAYPTQTLYIDRAEENGEVEQHQ